MHVIDPELFGRAVGEQIRSSTSPLAERIARLERALATSDQLIEDLERRLAAMEAKK